MSISNSLRPISIELSALKPPASKLRRHSKKQIAKIQEGLKRYGLLLPILISPDFEIIDGEGVCQALAANGATMVSAIVVDGHTPAELRALRLYWNRTPADATWDVDLLHEEFTFIKEAGIDLATTGFDVNELILIDRFALPAQQTAKLQSRHLPINSKRGDIWLCGEHRIGCGDALDQAFVDQVRGDARIALSLLDLIPPLPALAGTPGENHAEPSAALTFSKFTSSLKAVKSATSEDGLIFTVVDRRQLLELGAAGHACGLKIADICILLTDCTADSALYKNEYQAVAIFHNDDAKSLPIAPSARRNARRNVWRYAKGESDLASAHTMQTSRPIAFISDILLDATKTGDTVFDPSLGSGATLLAAHRTRRRCIGIEGTASLVDEAIYQWQSATRLKATKLSTGVIVDHSRQAPIPVFPMVRA